MVIYNNQNPFSTSGRARSTKGVKAILGSLAENRFFNISFNRIIFKYPHTFCMSDIYIDPYGLDTHNVGYQWGDECIRNYSGYEKLPQQAARNDPGASYLCPRCGNSALNTMKGICRNCGVLLP